MAEAGGGRGRGAGGETDDERLMREVDDLESQGPNGSALSWAYIQVRNELWAESHPVYRTALRRWDRRAEYMGIQRERKLTRRAELNTDIFNIVGFFSVFQGVVLTAESQLKSDTHSTCGLLLFPIILSSLAAVVAIIGVSLRFLSLRELERGIHSELRAFWDAARNAAKLRQRGNDFRFYKDLRDEDADLSRPKVPFFKYTLVIFALILFTAIFILSYFAILCNRMVIVKWEGGFQVGVGSLESEY